MNTLNLDDSATTGDLLVLRIRELSGRLRMGFWVFVGLFLTVGTVVVVGQLFGAFGSWTHETAYKFAGVRVDPQLLAGWQEVPFAMLACIPGLIGLAVVWQLERLLAAYEQGAILTVRNTVRNALRIRRVGQLLMGWFVAQPCIGVVGGCSWAASVWAPSRRGRR